MNRLKLLLIAFALTLFAAPALAQSRSMPSSSAAEAGRVVCSVQCVLKSFQVNSGATAVFVMLFDATAIPADGAVVPKRVYQLAVNTTLNATFGNEGGIQMSAGAVIVCSTTGPPTAFTKTASATCTFAAEVQ